MTVRFISAFAGIEGFGLGFEQAGMQCVAQIEIDSAARSVLARHWPDVPRFENIQDTGKHNLPECDVICGGFPCQDLSIAGKRGGLDGKRSGLFYELTRITNELRPAYLIWENVPGLLSSNGGRDMLTVLTELERIGYAGGWTTLDAQFFGVAQRRQRVFGVFARRDIGAERCAQILALPNRVPWHTPTRSQTRSDIARCLEASLGHHGHSSPRGSASDNLIVGALSANGVGTCGADDNQAQAMHLIPFDTTQITSALNRSNPQAGDPCHPLTAYGNAPALIFDWQSGGDVRLNISETHSSALSSSQVPAVARCDTARNTRIDGESETFVLQHAQIGRKDDAGPQGKGWQTDVSFTLDSRSTADAVAFSSGVRRLTPTECERLQGFSDGHTAGQSDSTRYRQLGNAVCVKVARWLGRQIVQYGGLI